MRNFDPSPLWRSTVGFDRLLDLLDESLSSTPDENYPSYNVERTGENTYRISLAVAGFTPDDISITAQQHQLVIEGRKAEMGDHRYLYRGIAARPFRRLFGLADYVQVKGAALDGGLLKIDLVREVPEAMKPRRIPIGAGNDNRMLENNAA